MKISIISEPTSWINGYIPRLITRFTNIGHEVVWVHKVSEIKEGELLFILGCGQLIPLAILQLHRHNLVVHESGLPHGRGWSPLTWQIIEGKNVIPIVLFEAAEEVDSGKIYMERTMVFGGFELIDELRRVQAETSLDMCFEFTERYPEIISEGIDQQGEPSYYPRRLPKDSRLDPNLTIKEQFNLLRVVDNDRYPAYFELHGEKYVIRIEKGSEKNSR